MNASVQISVADQFATIVIENEAKRNAMSIRMWRQLGAAVSKAETHPNTRVLIVRGSGQEAFCVGGDFDDLATLTDSYDARLNYLEDVERALGALRASRLPTLAVIHGFAIGGGMAIACMCDLRVADARLRLGIPATHIGIVPSTIELTAIVEMAGYSRAMDLLYTGRLLDASEAVHWGLVNRIFQPEELEEQAQSLASDIADAAPIALQTSKRLLGNSRHAGRAGLRDSVESLGGPEFRAELERLSKRRGRPESA